MEQERSPSYAQVARILQQALGEEEGLLVMEFILSHMPHDVARERDVAQVRLEIEQVRADLTERIEQVRADLTERIEQVRADLTERIEQVRADLTEKIEQVRAELKVDIEQVRLEIEQVRLKIEQVRAELTEKIERTRAEVIRWSFLFWASQMALLVGILFQLLK